MPEIISLPGKLWRAVLGGALVLTACAGAIAGCRTPVATQGEAANQVPVSVTVAVPRKQRGFGLSRGVLATDFTLPLMVRLGSTGLGHSYALGWKFELDQALVEDPLDPGVVKAVFTGITAQSGKNRIFRAQVHDATAGLRDSDWPARALDDVWGIADVPTLAPVTLTHASTPTAKIMRELLQTADGERANALVVADVQALVDRLRTHDEALGAARATPVAGLNVLAKPVALAIANGARDASGVYTPYVVPSPAAYNKLETIGGFANTTRVRLQVLNGLGQATTLPCVLTLDDPLTAMARTASGTQATHTWTDVPVTTGSQAFSYWSATVVEPSTARHASGKLTLSNQDDVTCALSLPLPSVSERLAGGPGLAAAQWSHFPLQKELRNPRSLNVAGDVLYWAEDGASTDTYTLNALDLSKPNPRVEVVAAGNDTLTGLTIDHLGNPVFATTFVIRNGAGAVTRALSKFHRVKVFAGGTVATDPIVPGDGSVELYADGDNVSGWGLARPAGPLAFDVPSRRLIAFGVDRLFRFNYTSLTPNTSVSVYSANPGVSSDMSVNAGYLYFGHSWVPDPEKNPNRHLFFLGRRWVSSLSSSSQLTGTQPIYSAASLSPDDLGFSRLSSDVGVGKISGAPAFDEHGNRYFCVDGRVLRMSTAYGQSWLTDMRLPGTSVAYDPARKSLYIVNAGATPAEIRRITIEP